MKVFCFMFYDFYKKVGNKSTGNSIRNTVTEGEEHDGKETGDCSFKLTPFNFDE